ncbi:hypothetical protein D3C71_2066540 [compost metagenome]
MLGQLVLRNRLTRHEHHEGTANLAPARVGHADNSDLAYGWMGGHHGFDLNRIDVLAT